MRSKNKQKGAKMLEELKIDPEFAGKISPLTPEEYDQLKNNILADGIVLNPLITWNGFIVDGHNRYRILQMHPEIPYQLHEKEFSDRFEVIAWICKNQLGRRNLTEEQKKYLVGKQYEAEKAMRGGDRKSEGAKSKGQNVHLISPERTSERIAKEIGKNERYVRRAEGFAQGIDAAEAVLPGIKEEILSGKIKTTDKEMSDIAKASPEKRQSLVQRLVDPGGKYIADTAEAEQYPTELPSEEFRNAEQADEDIDPEENRQEMRHAEGSPVSPDKRTRAEELKDITAIYETMLSPQGEDTMEDVLGELDSALESLIFRWNFCLENHEALVKKKENRKQIRELARKGITYLKTAGI